MDGHKVSGLTPQEGSQVLDRSLENPLHGLAAVEGNVRRDDDVVAIQKRVVEEQRAQLVLSERLSQDLALVFEEFFPFENIEGRAGQDAVVQRLGERRRIDQPSTRCVDQQRPTLEISDVVGVNQVMSLGRVRTM